MPPKLRDLLTSRKFWAAVIGLLIVIVKGFRPDFPLTDAQITDLVYVLIAFIVGTGLESGLAQVRADPRVRPDPPIS